MKNTHSCSKLDQYGGEPFEQQQFGTAGVEGVNCLLSVVYIHFQCFDTVGQQHPVCERILLQLPVV